MRRFLHTAKTDIVLKGKKIILKGINLGGWLMMEGYILHSLNKAEQLFKKNFARTLGASALKVFEKSFRDNFVQESDFKKIARLEFNCVRVPFHYRLIEKQPYRYDQEGLKILDKVIQWGEKHRLWIILDLHAACGSQNHDWHSDSLGPAALWTKKNYQDRTVALWGFLADRYKEKKSLAGYDILNEAVTDDPKCLNAFYKRVIKSIRQVDKDHIVFVEGNRWATDLDCLARFDDDNLALSIHFYMPLEFTFNFVPQLTYPLSSAQGRFNKTTMQEILGRYQRIAEKRSVPIFVGEFGVNNRQGYYGEDQWLRDALDYFQKQGFHWTYWTYKAVKNAAFPDGIFSYMGNPAWVNRQGPQLGWDNFAAQWPRQRKAMIKSWQTPSFSENKKIFHVLQRALRN